MSRVLSKSGAVKFVRAYARKAGASSTAFDVRPRRVAGVCEFWLRAKVGMYPDRRDRLGRAREMRLGRGRSWAAAAVNASRHLQHLAGSAS